LIWIMPGEVLKPVAAAAAGRGNLDSTFPKIYRPLELAQTQVASS
jgi:hypothetical protein